MKILLAEDNIDIRECFTHFLKLEGHEVDSYENGEKALQGYSDHDVIITDHEMPVMNGYELVVGIRQFDKLVPIFVCSGDCLITLAEKFKNLEVNGIFDKASFKSLVSKMEAK